MKNNKFANKINLSFLKIKNNRISSVLGWVLFGLINIICWFGVISIFLPPNKYNGFWNFEGTTLSPIGIAFTVIFIMSLLFFIYYFLTLKASNDKESKDYQLFKVITWILMVITFIVFILGFCDRPGLIKYQISDNINSNSLFFYINSNDNSYKFTAGWLSSLIIFLIAYIYAYVSYIKTFYGNQIKNWFSKISKKNTK